MVDTSQKIRVAINGYGNLGRAVELAVENSDDMELVAIFTRRDPESLDTQFAPAVSIDEAPDYVDKVDVCVLCGGSATDLVEQGPEFVKMFNTVDSYDNHSKIPEYFASIDRAAKSADRVGVISAGWDPGLFSLNRLIGEAVLPNGSTTTFWGPGVSQGHSQAVRNIEGVVDAVQYTVPIEETKERIRSGEKMELTTRDKHRRECFVVAEDGADLDRIREEIVTMPGYFADYDTTVEFISQEELDHDHGGIPHGGDVIRVGETSPGNTQAYSFNLALDSNPEFTGAVATAAARAAYRMYLSGFRGAASVFDIPPAYYSPKTGAQLRKELL